MQHPLSYVIQLSRRFVRFLWTPSSSVGAVTPWHHETDPQARGSALRPLTLVVRVAGNAGPPDTGRKQRTRSSREQMRELYFDPKKMRPLGDRVVAAGVKGMTAKDSTETKPRPFQDPVASDRLFGEMGTGRLISTSRPKEGMNHSPIEEKEQTDRI